MPGGWTGEQSFSGKRTQVNGGESCFRTPGNGALEATVLRGAIPAGKRNTRIESITEDKGSRNYQDFRGRAPKEAVMEALLMERGGERGRDPERPSTS